MKDGAYRCDRHISKEANFTFTVSALHHTFHCFNTLWSVFVQTTGDRSNHKEVFRCSSVTSLQRRATTRQTVGEHMYKLSVLARGCWPASKTVLLCLPAVKMDIFKNRHKKVSDSHNTYSLINCKTALNMMMMTVCAYERVDELAPASSSTCRPVSNPSCRCYILCEQASAIHRHHWNKNNWLQWT